MENRGLTTDLGFPRTVQVCQGTIPDPVVRFLQDIFVIKKGRTGDLRQMFPLAFSPDERNFCLVLNEGDAVVGTLVVRLVHPPGFRLGLVGFVATQESYRGMGVARQLLAEFDRLAVREQIGIGLLWASKQALYAKRGWHPENLFPTQRVLCSEPMEDVSAIPISDGERLFQLAQQGEQFLWRTKEDFLSLARVSWHMHFGLVRSYLFTHKDQAVGYAVVGDHSQILEIVVEPPERRRPCLNALGLILNAKEWVCPADPQEGTTLLQEDRLTMVKVFDETFRPNSLKGLSLSPLDRI